MWNFVCHNIRSGENNKRQHKNTGMQLAPSLVSKPNYLKTIMAPSNTDRKISDCEVRPKHFNHTLMEDCETEISSFSNPCLTSTSGIPFIKYKLFMLMFVGLLMQTPFEVLILLGSV